MKLVDISSYVEEARGYARRLLESNSDSLTQVQTLASRKNLTRDLKNEGVSISINTDVVKDRVEWATVHWPSPGVEGRGIITDVTEKGVCPIRLAIGNDVAIYFDPNGRNVDLAHLGKGTLYEFQGKIMNCNIQFDKEPNGRLEFFVYGFGAFARFFNSIFG